MFCFQFEGRGKYFFANGDRYEGEFLNGERHGDGLMFFNSGGFREGTWRNDNLVGEVSLRTNFEEKCRQSEVDSLNITDRYQLTAIELEKNYRNILQRRVTCLCVQPSGATGFETPRQARRNCLLPG